MGFATACWWLRCPQPARRRSWETTSLSNPTRRTCTSAGFCLVSLCRPRRRSGGETGETDVFDRTPLGHGLFWRKIDDASLVCSWSHLLVWIDSSMTFGRAFNRWRQFAWFSSTLKTQSMPCASQEVAGLKQFGRICCQVCRMFQIHGK